MLRSQTGISIRMYTYDNEGRMTSYGIPLAGDTYNYLFDTTGRPKELTKTGSSTSRVKDVTYGPAGEMTQIKIWNTSTDFWTETRTYNPLLQLTRITQGSNVDLEYRYSSTQNNGLITQRKDWISGEEISYQADSLQRLTSAVTTGPEWGLSFSYDGFGNRTAQSVTKGSAPTSSLTVNPANNRLTDSAFSYDANGNMTKMPGPGCTLNLAYDEFCL